MKTVWNKKAMAGLTVVLVVASVLITELCTWLGLSLGTLMIVSSFSGMVVTLIYTALFPLFHLEQK